jgi:hypothetical protein
LNVIGAFTTTRVGHEIDALRRLAVRLRKLEPEEVFRRANLTAKSGKLYTDRIHSLRKYLQGRYGIC